MRMITSWKLLCCMIAIAISIPKVSTVCQYQALSSNTFVSGTYVYCFDVPEASAVGTSICTFKALGADSVTINPSGPLSPYNDLQSQDNGDGSLNISLFAKTSYSNYVDGETTPDSTIDDRLTCYSSDGDILNTNLFVTIIAENTQKPTFTETSGTYNYIDVPEVLPTGVDITILGYGNPIIATDTDYNFGEENYDAAIIVFEVQGGSEDWTVASVLVSTDRPYTYRAAIAANKSLDYPAKPVHEFVLIAKNADGNQVQISTTNVTVRVGDYDNLAPKFNSSYYSTTVSSTMISIIGIHELATTPEIYAYDQDTGINQQLIYSINTDCGASVYCDIVKNYFTIDANTGSLYFASSGSWPYYDVTSVSFLILATQTDNQDKTANAYVIAVFQIPA